MSHNYILSVLSIADRKLIAHRRHQLELIRNVYKLTKDIPSERWGPRTESNMFNQRSLFGHYAEMIDAKDPSIARAHLVSAPLRAALNDFTESEYEIGAVLEGLVSVGSCPVPMADAAAAIPDYKQIAMSLLELIMEKYPQTKHDLSMAFAGTKNKQDTRSLDHVRMPYKD